MTAGAVQAVTMNSDDKSTETVCPLDANLRPYAFFVFSREASPLNWRGSRG